MSQETIKAVENGLLPAIKIEDQPLPSIKLADQMQRYNVPGVSIAVIDQAEIKWARGYGVQKAGASVPITAQTRFQAASISKAVTAMAVLRLAQTGKLDLDADVNQVLRSWHLPENEHTRDQQVTLRGILSHTAGLTVHGFRGYAAGDQIPNIRQVLDGEPPANSDPIRVDSVPGRQFWYSGGGYTVIQQLLEDVTGKPFPEFMQATVLDRLHMAHSTFAQPLPRQLAGQAAVAHGGDGRPIDGDWHTYPELAAAGLWTTPSDLARFAAEVLQSYEGGSNRILSVEMTREMLTRHIGYYGLGFGIEPFDGSIGFSHGGGNQGFRCFLVGYTGTGQGAVVMTNGDYGHLLMMEILRGIAHVYGWADFQPTEKRVVQVNPDLYARYTGEYRLVDLPKRGAVISSRDGRLYMQAVPDGICHELYPESETTYFALEREQSFTFVQDDEGAVSTLMVDSQAKMERVK